MGLPRTYSGELPRLASGPLAGYPRVYAIALELISHGDGRVDAACKTGLEIFDESVTEHRDCPTFGHLIGNDGETAAILRAWHPFQLPSYAWTSSGLALSKSSVLRIVISRSPVP